MQVSGIQFTFNPDNHVDNRVSEIFINGVPLIDDKIYTLATEDFLLSGGDGYTILKKLSIIGKYNTCEEVLAEYLIEVGSDKINTGRILKE